MTIEVSDLNGDLPFGARIRGVSTHNVDDPDVQRTLRAVFDDRGMIVFEGMEPTTQMQLALSAVFGPPEAHAIREVKEVEGQAPGLVQFDYLDVFEVNGQELAAFVPWHFDACYAGQINRGGVLRALAIPPEGGITSFADGIQLYQALPAKLREAFAGRNIVYHSHLMFWNLKFGRPASYNPVRVRPAVVDMVAAAKAAPRAIHPAIWERPDGRHVLHVSPWQAAGIEGMETPEGDALLEDLCAEMQAAMRPWHHRWQADDMVIWDNWRFIHAVSGHPPHHPRQMRRTTIAGDYGLGHLES